MERKSGRFVFGFFSLALIMALIFSSCAPMEGRIKPPETRILKAQNKYGPTGVSFEVSGKDDRTPTEKLRYAFWILEKNEKTQILNTTYEASSTTGLISVDSKKFQEGNYIFRVTAINEFGKADESPEEILFTVDFTAPSAPKAATWLEESKIKVSSYLEKSPDDFSGFFIKISSSEDSKDYPESDKIFLLRRFSVQFTIFQLDPQTM